MLMLMREILTLMLALWPRLTAPPENGQQRCHNIPLFTSPVLSQILKGYSHWEPTASLSSYSFLSLCLCQPQRLSLSVAQNCSIITINTHPVIKLSSPFLHFWGWSSHLLHWFEVDRIGRTYTVARASPMGAKARLPTRLRRPVLSTPGPGTMMMAKMVILMKMTMMVMINSTRFLMSWFYHNCGRKDFPVPETVPARNA